MYNLEENKIIEEIKSSGAKRVLFQFPDGLKPKAGELAKKIENETGSDVLIWFGSCYGACDLPQNVDSLGVDLVVSFGHNQYRKETSW